MTRRLLPTLATALLPGLALAAPARAGEVLVVERDRVTVRDDPYLPPRTAADLPPPAESKSIDPRSAGASRSSRAPSRSGARAARGPTVRAALRDALLVGTLPQEDHDRYREIYLEARRVRGRLEGARRAELHSVILTLERIADAGELTPGRMRPLFIQLDRNTEFWRARPFPPGGARLTFSGSPLVFQYYRGEGLQIQPLANFGKANGLYNACEGINTRPGVSCRRGALRELLDELVRIAAQRADFTAWEYYFRFGGGRPPWISGLAQGTAIQALARGSQLLEEPSYLEVARTALAAFERRPPLGVRVPEDGGNHYLIYSFNPRLKVLNGFLQSVIGLHDYAEISGDPRGQALFQAGDIAARAAVPRYDTGAWSLYTHGHREHESDLGYHRLVRDFLRGLCERLDAPVYCETEERFTRYLLEHPTLDYLGAGRRARARRPVPLRFRLSKISRVSVQVIRGGRIVYSNRLTLGYGPHSFVWRPRDPGRYVVRLEAADLRNHHTVVRGSLTVRR